MLLQTILDDIILWLITNINQIIVVALAIIIGWIVYLIIKRNILIFKKKGRLEESTAKNVLRLVKIIIGLIIISSILVQFVEALGLITSLFTLMGGTIIGFAAINTFGNIIAGFIIMISRPFVSGDYILYNNKVAKVEEIDFIYTKLIDLDRVKISIPNQKLLTIETENLGKKGIIRRSLSITADYHEDRNKVENALLEAVKKVPLILIDPNPFVRISNFLNFAVEYSILYFINEIRSIRKIEANLRVAIFDTMNQYNIDISTPSLIKNLKMKTE